MRSSIPSIAVLLAPATDAYVITPHRTCVRATSPVVRNAADPEAFIY